MLLPLLLLLLTLPASAARAQQGPSPTPTPTPPAASLERRFLKNVLRDQKAIWTSPLRLRGDDAKWLVPLTLATAGLVSTDRRVAGSLDDSGAQVRAGEAVSKLGSFYTAAGVSAAFYVAGRYKGNARARETGVLGAEALVNAVIVHSVLKAATQRERPLEGDRRGRFFEGGTSFPSAHSVHAWTIATVVARQYSDRRAVRLGAYGLAAAASLARVAARKHFPSDVLVGGAIGYGIGRYVHRASKAGAAGGGEPSPLFPQIAPAFDRRSGAYGVRLTWGF
ncbi:MAG TPA: phosphatase PAP2 family protein [Pyrinomonadaceae bacterium]|jgi:membrane-associated phospholipid phosphatase